ncbi:DUF3253 domain-containing protein [Sphingomonas sp. RS2018]
MTIDDAARETLALLARRAPAATICPSEVARAIAAANGTSDDWRDAMPIVHTAVEALLSENRIALRWKGVDLPTRAGPYRIGAATRDPPPVRREDT